MFPGDDDLQKVKRAFFDPFEYLMHRNAAGLFKTDFKHELGKIAWQVACHQRVQNIGPKTRDVLNLVPGTEVITIERCSGHDGTYGVKKHTYEFAAKNRQAGGNPGQAGAAGALHLRLRDGRRAHRARARRRNRSRTSDQPDSQGLWHLRHSN